MHFKQFHDNLQTFKTCTILNLIGRLVDHNQLHNQENNQPVIPTSRETNVSTHSGTLRSSTSAASSYLGLHAFSDDRSDWTFSIASKSKFGTFKHYNTLHNAKKNSSDEGWKLTMAESWRHVDFTVILCEK